MLKKLSVHGFKSIQNLQNFELTNLNVLIGANGAGKSNFIELFRVLKAYENESLNTYASINGGADRFFFNGPKITPEIKISLDFELSNLIIELMVTVQGNFLTKSSQQYLPHYTKVDRYISDDVLRLSSIEAKIADWTIYHFHDTSNTAMLRRSERVEDNKKLRSNAENIAPFLFKLKQTDKKCYDKIIATIRLVAPFFKDFTLDVLTAGAEQKVTLSWQQKGSDYPMQAYDFSDGTLRFICLVTALLQPTPPSMIIIDEPELGLHPYAVEILSELIQAAAVTTQVIISTQSPALVDCFAPENIIVVGRENGASIFNRLSSQQLSAWLNDYTLGELWRKNILAGGSVSE